MSTKIQKWGNSLAVRLPQYLIEKLGLEAGTAVEIEEEAGRVITIKPTMKTKVSLKKLVNGINPQNTHNTHKEIDFGDPIGKEIW